MSFTVKERIDLFIKNLKEFSIRTYAKRLLIGLVDQPLNTILFGFEDETFSSRCYRWHIDGYASWPMKLVDTIFFFDKDHCKESFESEEIGRQRPPCLRPSATSKESKNK